MQKRSSRAEEREKRRKVADAAAAAEGDAAITGNEEGMFSVVISNCEETIYNERHCSVDL